jgi:GDP-4-dehydro-6-deoxy-D-mannose reductase
VKVLVTGADGFVGRYLVRGLLQQGADVAAVVRPGVTADAFATSGTLAPERIHTVEADLLDPEAPARLAGVAPDAVVHLAAVASGAEARAEPLAAWRVNVMGTLALLEALAAGASMPRVLLVSTAEVYGAGQGRRGEDDPVRPLSPYAASKAAAEIGAAEVAHRTGLPIVVARPFPHTGVGQTASYVVPAFLDRLAEAQRSGQETIPVGNLAPVRDLLDVRDVVAAYLGLLQQGRPGESYNVARGEGVSIRQVFDALAERLGVEIRPVEDPDLVRPADIPHLVGDAAKLTALTGWRPSIPLERTFAEMVDAQTH